MTHPFPRYTEAEATAAIARSKSYAEALRWVGMCGTGGGTVTLRKWAERWGIATEHFDPYASNRGLRRREPRPLAEVMVTNSNYSRSNLKRRLYEEVLKQPICELCGQGELWHGKRMALILDHINGDGRDHRLENLRIVCANCAATLDTHCGRKLRLSPIQCARCKREFLPRYSAQRFCSRNCGQRGDGSGKGTPRPQQRKVPRPSYEQLKNDLLHTSWLAVGRKYGVSDNAVRKWIRWYERDAEAQAAEAAVSRRG
jgi:hypothetical protein